MPFSSNPHFTFLKEVNELLHGVVKSSDDESFKDEFLLFPELKKMFEGVIKRKQHTDSWFTCNSIYLNTIQESFCERSSEGLTTQDSKTGKKHSYLFVSNHRDIL